MHRCCTSSEKIRDTSLDYYTQLKYQSWSEVKEKYFLTEKIHNKFLSMKSALPEGNLDLKRKLYIPKRTQE